MLTPVNPGNLELFYLISSLAAMKRKLLYGDVEKF